MYYIDNNDGNLDKWIDIDFTNENSEYDDYLDYLEEINFGSDDEIDYIDDDLYRGFQPHRFEITD